MEVTAIIPARYQSARFPGKPLVDIKGVPMIHRVYRQVEKSQLISEVIVATDSREIFSYCSNAQIPVLMTSPDHQSGTDRVAEVAQQRTSPIILNVQGDEPFIDPNHLDQLINGLIASQESIATLITLRHDEQRLHDQACVKVVRRVDGRALYFSRSPIPYDRGTVRQPASFWQHLGIYAFRRQALLEVTTWPISPLETREKLEQLRWLEGGYDIMTVEVSSAARGIDTPEDLKELIHWMDVNGIE